MRTIRNSVELLAHAIAIEREAAERYAELGERMGDLGNDLVAELFLRLARLEKDHEQELLRRAAGLKLPSLARAEYAWLDDGSPERAPHDLVLNLLTPHSALQIALQAEERAAAFKLTFLLSPVDGVDPVDLRRHWLDIHVPNYASNFVASGGVRYVVNIAEQTHNTDLVGLAEISYRGREAAESHVVPDDGFRSMIVLQALPGREQVITG